MNASTLASARRAITTHRILQARAELALANWLKAHRGVPRELLYGPDGAALDPQLAGLEAAVGGAATDVQWCRAVVVAVAEELKAEPFEVVVARNEAHRTDVGASRARMMSLIEGED